MGITVVAEDEHGERLALAGDPTNILHRVLPTPEDPTYHCLNRIDWYGDTTFNRLQVPILLEELKRLREAVADPPDLALLDEIEALAHISMSEPHLYLKFYGD